MKTHPVLGDIEEYPRAQQVLVSLMKSRAARDESERRRHLLTAKSHFRCLRLGVQRMLLEEIAEQELEVPL